MKEWKVPGLAVAAIKDDKVVFSRGYGFRDVESQLPVTPKTLFAIGSNSKSFTVTILGMLEDAGKIDFDKPVRDYLPDFRLHDAIATEQMTPRDLVCHRSGLPRHDLVWFATGLSREALYGRLRYLQPNKPFRSTYQYQNLMFMTAGYLEERVTGKKWEDLVHERIFQPLGMKRSNLSVADSQRDSDFAQPYAESDGKVIRVPFRNIDAIGPAGSINSSVEEMMPYIRLHIDQGKSGGQQLLSVKNSRQMQSPQMAIGAGPDSDPEIGPASYGLGVAVTAYRGQKLVLHSGGIDGFISAMAWLPDVKIGVMVLTNFSGTNPVPTLVSRHVFDRLLGLELIDWAKRTRERQARQEKQAEEARNKTAGERKPGTSPTHALADYAGRYEHPGYGAAEVTLEGSALRLRVAGFDLPLEHFHYDIFTPAKDKLPLAAASFRGSRLVFRYNKKGDIDRVTIPLEPSIEDIVFTRAQQPAAPSQSSGR
jgi:CubicO group peptidase (beta-lactamase class C family)